jgi:tight adherence protein C
MSAAGIVIGLMFGVGVVLTVASLRSHRVTLTWRLAPALRPKDATSALLRDQPARSPFPVVERLIAPWLTSLARWFERLGSPRVEGRRRLDRAGSPETVDQFRARQIVWTVAGLVAGLAFALFIGVARGFAPVPLALLVAIAGAVGFATCDQLLSRKIARREPRIITEFPTVAELLALAGTAGEAPVAALERVAATAHGDLSWEIRRCLADVRAGAAIGLALTDMSERIGLAPLTRFSEGVAVALERGTPLAEVLRAEAKDVMESGRRALMEAGGRKEIAMMVPVVFLILPITVVFAVFPTVATLHLGF